MTIPLHRKTWVNRFWLAVLAGLLNAVPAQAEVTAESTAEPPTEQSPQALNDQGRRYYERRDYRRAVESFLGSYALDPDPNLLFNIARCYDGLGELEAALEKYEQFLAAPSIDQRGRERAEQAIRSIEERRAQPSEPEPPLTQPVESRALPEPDHRAGPSFQSSDPVSLDRAAAPSGLPSLRWWMLGAGALGVATGAGLYYWGVRDHEEVTDASGYGVPGAFIALDRTRAEELTESGVHKKRLGVVAGGVGVGLLLGSLIVWLSHETPGESLAVRVGTDSLGGAQLDLMGVF